jgi:hypothetical protein
MWGAGFGANALPKNLTDEQKTRVYADNRGWNIIRPGHRDYLAGRTGTPVGEVLVTVPNLAANIGTSNITSAYFVSASYTTGATGKVRVHWDQLITPTTTGTLVVKQTNVTSAAVTNITATRVGNTTSNYIEYSFTAGNSTSYVYTIGAQTITQGIYGNITGTTSQLALVTSNVGVAGTKFRTVYGGAHGAIWSDFTNTSVTLTAA